MCSCMTGALAADITPTTLDSNRVIRVPPPTTLISVGQSWQAVIFGATSDTPANTCVRCGNEMDNVACYYLFGVCSRVYWQIY